MLAWALIQAPEDHQQVDGAEWVVPRPGVRQVLAVPLAMMECPDPDSAPRQGRRRHFLATCLPNSL